jgi:hypothetical protein
MNVLNRRIHVLALSLAGGMTWALSVAGLAVWVMSTTRGTEMLNFIADCYPYYDATVSGALWGLLWGFLDTFGGLFVFGLLYNIFAGKPKTV